MNNNNRKTPRAQWHDYNNGIYFVTFGTKNRVHYFGEISDGKMIFSPIGKFTERWISNFSKSHPNICILESVVMPDHIHMIVSISPKITENKNSGNLSVLPQTNDEKNVEMQRRALRCGNLSHMVCHLKVAVTRFALKKGIAFLWQARFHDHIIRNNEEFLRIQTYIKNNPSNWGKK